MTADRSSTGVPLLCVVAGGPSGEQLAAVIALSLVRTTPAPPAVVRDERSRRRADWKHRYRSPGSWRT
ncbi:acyl-CoA carboxylase epsilon subunit [Kitasatospora sp. NPDC098652]|uniref:acyl-CoA carboxylase epsilon subunit n=1 Tax=Kitasatospora sp. NPDC098652 TaxID=3364095 RepID=UPI00380B8C25